MEPAHLSGSETNAGDPPVAAEYGGGYATLVYCPNGMNPVCDDHPEDPALDACRETNLDGIRQ